MSDYLAPNRVSEYEKRMQLLATLKLYQVPNSHSYQIKLGFTQLNSVIFGNFLITSATLIALTIKIVKIILVGIKPFLKDIRQHLSLSLVKDIRQHLWTDPSENDFIPDNLLLKKASGRDYRNVQLIDSLYQMRNPKTKKIEYMIGYDRVSELFNICSF